MQLELTRAELEWLLFLIEPLPATMKKGPGAFDLLVDETGTGLLLTKLRELAESEGIDT